MLSGGELFIQPACPSGSSGSGTRTHSSNLLAWEKFTPGRFSLKRSFGESNLVIPGMDLHSDWYPQPVSDQNLLSFRSASDLFSLPLSDQLLILFFLPVSYQPLTFSVS